MSRGQTASKPRPAAPSKGPARGAAPAKRPAVKGREAKSMATKVAVKAKVPAKEEKVAPPEKEAPETTPDSPLPLLDLSDAAVKRMIKQDGFAREAG